MDTWRLCKDIQTAAKKKRIDPYNTPFKPEDLGLDGSNYGSFSDWCSRKETISGQYNRHVCLIVSSKHSDGSPWTYRLLPENEWYIE